MATSSPQQQQHVFKSKALQEVDDTMDVRPLHEREMVHRSNADLNGMCIQMWSIYSERCW